MKCEPQSRAIYGEFLDAIKGTGRAAIPAVPVHVDDLAALHVASRDSLPLL